MAEIVLGIGTSHSPMLLMEPPAWLVRGEKDRNMRIVSGYRGPLLRDFDGAPTTFEALLAKADPGMARQLAPEVLEGRHAANQRALDELAQILAAAQADVLIMFGDDHHEVFHDDNMPAVSLYWGESIPYKPTGLMAWPYDPSLRRDLWYWQDEREFPVAAGLGERLVGDLVQAGVDIASSHRYAPGQGMSHSFAFVYRRLMGQEPVPTIPIHINTYFPPNQVPPRRAYEIGRLIRQAVEAWPERLRVAVLGSGGLSHFVVDEELDRLFLETLRSASAQAHAALPLAKLNSGNSELRCWSAAAGAVDHLRFRLIDYVPCYRSPAGTGCAMAFATWS